MILTLDRLRAIRHVVLANHAIIAAHHDAAAARAFGHEDAQHLARVLAWKGAVHITADPAAYAANLAALGADPDPALAAFTAAVANLDTGIRQA